MNPPTQADRSGGVRLENSDEALFAALKARGYVFGGFEAGQAALYVIDKLQARVVELEERMTPPRGKRLALVE